MIDISLYNSQSSGEKRSKEDPALNFNQLGHGDRTERGEIKKKLKCSSSVKVYIKVWIISYMQLLSAKLSPVRVNLPF